MAEILQYIHGDSLLHRLNPLTKILFILVVGIATILTEEILLLFILFLSLLLIAGVSGLLREILRQSTLIALMSVIIFVITILTLPSGTVIGHLIPQALPLIGGAIPITVGALVTGAILTLRFMVLITLFQIFIISTQPRDLVHTLEKMRVPAEYTLMFVIALRFIPTLQLEAQRIHEAQLARGYNPGRGFIGKIKSLSPLLVPLVSNSLAKTSVIGLTIDL
ncbi:MAG TPA: energy-coupling factor transporter transmembrane component T, partial [Methanomicrobiales archaeon]|nr:energy-coupling factor transporter transmembrane component T [Methanomicrobiales archaeon]